MFQKQGGFPESLVSSPEQFKTGKTHNVLYELSSKTENE